MITLLSALPLPDGGERGSGGSRYQKPLELSSGGSNSPETRRCGRNSQFACNVAVEPLLREKTKR